MQKLATGESPKNLLLSGKCDVLFLEEILCALAVRGAIRAVEDPGGHELSIPIVLPDFSKLEIEGELRSALPPSVAPKAGPLELSGSERPTFEPLTATDVESQEEVSSPIPNEPMTFAKMPDDEVSAPAPAAVELSAEPRAHVSERTDVDGVPLVRLMEPGRVTTDVDHTLYAGSVPAPALEPEPVFSPPTLRAEGVSAPMTPAITPTSMKPVIEPTPDDASLRSVSVRLDMHEADSPSALPMEPVSSPPPPMARDASLPPKRGARFVHSALIFAGAVAAGIVLMQSLGDKGAAAPPPAQATDFGNQPTITYKTISSGAPEGRVEVEASGPNVRIDGIDRGTGPDLVLTLPPGSHRIDQGEGRSAWSFEVRPGSIARVRLPSGP